MKPCALAAVAAAITSSSVASVEQKENQVVRCLTLVRVVGWKYWLKRTWSAVGYIFENSRVEQSGLLAYKGDLHNTLNIYISTDITNGKSHHATNSPDCEAKPLVVFWCYDRPATLVPQQDRKSAQWVELLWIYHSHFRQPKQQWCLWDNTFQQRYHNHQSNASIKTGEVICTCLNSQRETVKNNPVRTRRIKEAYIF